MSDSSTTHDAAQPPAEPVRGILDLDLSQHPVLARLADEVRNEEASDYGTPGAYNRKHNRHNRT